MENCIFCKIASGEINSRLVYRDDDIVAFKDLNPQAPTHIIVIPVKHIGSLSQTEEKDCALLGKLQLAVKKIASELGLKDFRVVLNNGKGAGQTIAHLHYHVMSGRRFLWPAG
jgi:histidine triad (HIT) family protein